VDRAWRLSISRLSPPAGSPDRAHGSAGFDLRAEAVLATLTEDVSSPARSKAKSWTRTRCGPRSREGWHGIGALAPPSIYRGCGRDDARCHQKYSESLTYERCLHGMRLFHRAQRHDQDHRRCGAMTAPADAGGLRSIGRDGCTTKLRVRRASKRNVRLSEVVNDEAVLDPVLKARWRICVRHHPSVR